MNKLAKQSCEPCKGGVPPYTQEQINEYLPQIDSAWEVVEGKKIKRLFSFTSFKESIDFVNRVADLAEQEGHHPDIAIHYDKVEIQLWTYAINGLFSNDFILAAKIDTLI